MTRNELIELIESICWSCWWREGSHCFSEKFGDVPKTGITLIGHNLNADHIIKCRTINGYQSKRSMLPIPKEKLIILSEFAKSKSPA